MFDEIISFDLVSHSISQVFTLRRQPFDKTALLRYNFSGIVSFVLGEGRYGWAGNSSNASVLDVYNEVLSARSAKEILRFVYIKYTMSKNGSSFRHEFSSSSDLFHSKLVSHVPRSKCFSLYPRPMGGLEKPEGVIFLAFNASYEQPEYDIEINYPGQYYYYLSDLEAKRDEIMSTPKILRTYYVTLSLSKL